MYTHRDSHTHTHAQHLSLILCLYVALALFQRYAWQWHLTFTLNAHVYLCVWGGVWWLDLMSFPFRTHTLTHIYVYEHCSNDFGWNASGAFGHTIKSDKLSGEKHTATHIHQWTETVRTTLCAWQHTHMYTCTYCSNLSAQPTIWISQWVLFWYGFTVSFHFPHSVLCGNVNRIQAVC